MGIIHQDIEYSVYVCLSVFTTCSWDISIFISARHCLQGSSVVVVVVVRVVVVMVGVVMVFMVVVLVLMVFVVMMVMMVAMVTAHESKNLPRVAD